MATERQKKFLDRSKAIAEKSRRENEKFARVTDWATLYTDASWHVGVMGWGAWLRYPDGRVLAAGSGEAPGSFQAEMLALIEGLKILGQLPNIVTNIQGIAIRTDNEQVARLAKWRAAPPKDRWMYQQQQEIERLCQFYVIKRQVRWTKGHDDSPTAPAYLNRQVDALAKKHMRARRDNRPIEPYLSHRPIDDQPEDWDPEDFVGYPGDPADYGDQ